MNYYLQMMNGQLYQIVRESYEAFELDQNDPDILFHNFRDIKGIIHTVAKMGILSLALESGIAVKVPPILL